MVWGPQRKAPVAQVGATDAGLVSVSGLTWVQTGAVRQGITFGADDQLQQGKEEGESEVGRCGRTAQGREESDAGLPEEVRGVVPRPFRPL